MKIVQFSDTHLSHRGGAVTDNFERLARFVNERLRPDLVVHSGDVSILDPDDARDRATGRELLALLEAPVRVIPGNHDVGEPGPDPWGGFAATSARLAAFTDAFGPDHWMETVGDHAVIGLDSEILSTGIPEEREQWDWLETLRERVDGRPAVVFTHKPVWRPTERPGNHPVAVPDDVRDRLLAAFAGIDVRAFCSGHLHHYAVTTRAVAGPTDGDATDMLAVSAPSSAFVVHGYDAVIGAGLNQCGVVEYRCDDAVTPFFRSTPDLVEGGAGALDSMAAAMRDLGMTSRAAQADRSARS